MDSILDKNGKYIFIVALYLGIIAFLYGLTTIGVISIGSFILACILILVLYFVFKKKYNKTIKKLRKENTQLKNIDVMSKICKNNQNKYCDSYNKKKDIFEKEIAKLYDEYNNSIS
tara:strand:+ start:1083 stop:1430 length:348 start_codon:yes stop_codon:yes gene_type:complete